MRINSSEQLIQYIASDTVLEKAYEWLCERRKDYSSNDEVWDLRRRWVEQHPDRFVVSHGVFGVEKRHSIPLRDLLQTPGFMSKVRTSSALENT